jgi:hypothetical protein
MYSVSLIHALPDGRAMPATFSMRVMEILDHMSEGRIVDGDFSDLWLQGLTNAVRHSDHSTHLDLVSRNFRLDQQVSVPPRSAESGLRPKEFRRGSDLNQLH